MLSFHHEILVELFRGDGKLAVELLRSCAGIAVDHTHVALGSIDLSQVAPAEYRADAVVILHNRDDRPVTGVIVEVQRQEDPARLLSQERRRGLDHDDDAAVDRSGTAERR